MPKLANIDPDKWNYDFHTADVSRFERRGSRG
jgi:hypothetical protein